MENSLAPNGTHMEVEEETLTQFTPTLGKKPLQPEGQGSSLPCHGDLAPGLPLSPELHVPGVLCLPLSLVPTCQHQFPLPTQPDHTGHPWFCLHLPFLPLSSGQEGEVCVWGLGWFWDSKWKIKQWYRDLRETAVLGVMRKLRPSSSSPERPQESKDDRRLLPMPAPGLEVNSQVYGSDL